LKPAQTVDEGRAGVQAAIDRLASAESDPEFRRLTVFSRAGGLSQVSELRELGVFFVVLLTVSALVLAIACANVAGLLLARGLARRREIALRLALGASRGRVIQQLLIESALLSAFGTLVGAVLTVAAFAAISQVALPVPVPVELRLTVDWRLMAFAIGLMVVSAGITGLMPALQTTRAVLLPAIRLDDRQFFARRLTLRSVLVGGQVAVSVVLLVAALVFVRSLARTGAVDPGFDVDRVLVARVAYVEGRQGTTGRHAVEDVLERVRSIAGVGAASFSDGVPLTIFDGYRTGTRARFEGVDGEVRVNYDGNRVGPGYFATMGIRIVRGRDFTDADRSGSRPVVIINEEFARRYFPGVDPLGRHMSFSRTVGPGDEIIGIVSNSKYRSLAELQDAALYEPLLSRGPERMVHVLVRTPGDPAALGSAVREAVLSTDPTAAVSLAPLRGALAFAVLPSRMGSILLGLLAFIGTMLAMTGLFGVVAFAVGRRTHEIAIRMTLGASRRGVLQLVTTDAVRLVIPGIAFGVLLAWLVTSPLSAFLVAGVNPGDPMMLGAAAALLILASLGAVWVPASRALRIAPARALKLE
jgi:predicted permease